jgi:hypothetical protein
MLMFMSETTYEGLYYFQVGPSDSFRFDRCKQLEQTKRQGAAERSNFPMYVDTFGNTVY